eukprot:TRINITY_DN7585_c0_g1_i1.p1 TRINITY_DN7585_c0_g1~~TRINITY_DN7585_c0_g1_i1.p1  ORF type:complete len:402 (+),score=127.89 TRINITY_DN7585_c0_g1_i1:138-1343(+)
MFQSKTMKIMAGRSRTKQSLFGIFLCVLMVANASFEVSDRSNEVKYTVKVYTVEEAKGIKFEGQLVPMTSVYRQKMDCYLPVEKEYVQEKHLGEQERDINKLLSPLIHTGQNCIYRLEGWWTYEFCFFKHIRQMHQENGKVLRPQDEFYLGKFVAGSGVEEQDYYSETYNQGTPCDIAGENQRKTTVRYECSPDTSTMISSIREPSTCTYVVTIASPYICKHPNYRPKKERIDVISCVYTKHQDLKDDEEIEVDGKHESLRATSERAMSRLPKKRPVEKGPEVPPSHQHHRHPGSTGAEKVLHKGKMSVQELDDLRQLQNLVKSKKTPHKDTSEGEDSEEVIEIELVDDEEGTIMEKLARFAQMSEKIRKQEKVEKHSSHKPGSVEEEENEEIDSQLKEDL